MSAEPDKTYESLLVSKKNRYMHKCSLGFENEEEDGGTYTGQFLLQFLSEAYQKTEGLNPSIALYPLAESAPLTEWVLLLHEFDNGECFDKVICQGYKTEVDKEASCHGCPFFSEEG